MATFVPNNGSRAELAQKISNAKFLGSKQICAYSRLTSLHTHIRKETRKDISFKYIIYNFLLWFSSFFTWYIEFLTIYNNRMLRIKVHFFLW